MNRIFTYLQFFIRNIPGAFGQKIRSFFYSPFFGSFGKNVRIDIGVIFDNPKNIFFGSDIWVMPYSHLTANTSLNPDELKSKRPIYFKKLTDYYGKIIIEDQVSIGSFNIIQGYGGVWIKKFCTTSARCSIYSMSHAVYNKKNRKLPSYSNSMVKDSTNIPSIVNGIELGEGVWLGYSVVVFSGKIEKNTFVKTNSVVNSNIDENIIYSENGELKKRFL